MIGLLTKVKIVDNSGAIEGRCIRIYGKKFKGYIGDTVLLSITNIAKGSNIKRGEKYKAIIVRIKKGDNSPLYPFVTR
jgi:ribosomal protein L14